MFHEIGGSERLTEVSPRISVVGGDGLKEYVGVLNGAELAVVCGRLIHEVSAKVVHVRLGVLQARLAGPWLKRDQLAICTLDGGVCKTDRQHAADKIREWRKAVHEDPEPGEVGGLCEDTAEKQAEREHQVGNVATVFGRFDTRDDHMCECGSEEQEHPDEEEELESTEMNGVGGLSVAVQTNRVVPAEENKHRHE
jgi:hypothetical protein